MLFFLLMDLFLCSFLRVLKRPDQNDLSHVYNFNFFRRILIFVLLEAYINRTASLRGEKDHLFISFLYSHNKVSSQSL